MLGVLIIPTGIGARIGGDAGDGNPVCKLLAGCCDTLITHPNVVNASDINEMPDNVLYVEGSMLDRFLAGDIQLRQASRPNRILVLVNPPVTGETINAVSAARATIGVDAVVKELTEPLRMTAWWRHTADGRSAAGGVNGLESAIEDIKKHPCDAVAIHTPVNVSRDVALDYYRNGGVNPWGGVEAILSKTVSKAIDKPVAHAPLETTSPDDEELFLIFKEPVATRIAAEAISNCYLHSVLKGLHRAPRIGAGLSYRDVDFMVSPYRCWGPAHDACRAKRIPIIGVRENCILGDEYDDAPDILVENYLEASGLIMAWRAGVAPSSVRANMEETTVIRQDVETMALTGIVP